MSTVSNTLIISLGAVGYKMADGFAAQLQQRHVGTTFPAIQFLPLLEEEGISAEKHTLPALGLKVNAGHKHIRPIANHLFPARDWASVTSEFSNQLAQAPRPRGQIALHHYIYDITERIRVARRIIFSSATLDQLSQQSMSIANPKRLNVYLLVSLADTFMSGLLPDLPYIINYILSEATPEDTFIDINLVLALPGFQGDVSVPQYRRVNAHQKMALEAETNANAAACLREIDYFLAEDHHYDRQFASFLHIKSNHNPLGGGRIYLLEPTNEAEKTLDDVTALANMSGEWLYHATMTGLRETVEAPQLLARGRRYSSFGHSSLRVPLGQWIERVAIKKELELLSDMLRGGKRGDSAETSDIAATRTQLHIDEASLQNALTEHTKYRDIRLQTLQFRNIPLTNGAQFIKRVQKRYSDTIGEQLPETRADMQYRKRQLTSKQNELGQTIIVDLEQHVLNLLDDPNGGITRAHFFLEALANNLRSERATSETTQNERRHTALAMQPRIDKTRRQFVGHTAVAAGPANLPFLWLGMMLLAGLVPVFLTVTTLTGSRAGGGGALWTMLLVLLAVSGFILWRTIKSIVGARGKIVKSYDARLVAFRDAEVQEALVQLYDDLISWAGTFRHGVNRVWETLTALHTDLNSQWEAVADTNALCGLSSSRLSEYLLSPAAIDQVERRLPLLRISEIGEQVREQIGTPSLWLQKDISQAELGKRIGHFAREHVTAPLARYDLAAALRDLPQHELIAKLDRVGQLSQPFWRHDPARTGVLEPAVHTIGTPPLDAQLKQLFGAESVVVEIDDRYEIVASGIRHGFGLDQMTGFGDIYARAYATMGAKTQHLLHTTDDRQALPNPLVAAPEDIIIKTMPLRQLYGVARALDVLKQSNVENQGQAIVWQHNGETLLLGYTAVEAMTQINKHADLANGVRQSVATNWQGVSSAEKIKHWSTNDYAGSSEQWAQLAAQDFLKEIDPANPLIAA